MITLLRQTDFVNLAPAVIYATLLDQGLYLCSIRTMYRILHEHQEVRERRRQSRHPVYQKPELIAEAPNQAWSWDITKLLVPRKWTYFYLYVIIDIFSRRIVGWHIADTESASLFRLLFQDAVTKHDIFPGELTLHADRGLSMKAKATALMLADLGVTKSHSRPYMLNDNPFSESHFKTMKCQPQFPAFRMQRIFVQIHKSPDDLGKFLSLESFFMDGCRTADPRIGQTGKILRRQTRNLLTYMMGCSSDQWPK